MRTSPPLRIRNRRFEPSGANAMPVMSLSVSSHSVSVKSVGSTKSASAGRGTMDEKAIAMAPMSRARGLGFLCIGAVCREWSR